MYAQGTILIERLQGHGCEARESAFLALVTRDPRTWVLQLSASFGTIVQIVKFCPFCGAKLE